MADLMLLQRIITVIVLYLHYILYFKRISHTILNFFQRGLICLCIRIRLEHEETNQKIHYQASLIFFSPFRSPVWTTHYLLNLKEWHVWMLLGNAKFGGRGCFKVDDHEAMFFHDSQLDAMCTEVWEVLLGP